MRSEKTIYLRVQNKFANNLINNILLIKKQTNSNMAMNDFKILNLLGNEQCKLTFIGSGSFSEVFRVRRLSDNCEYALKKVRVTNFKHS